MRSDPLEICTLPPEDLSQRLGWLRSEILPHARTRQQTADGFSWELDDAPGLARKLDLLVELESKCCSGIVFEHEAGPTAGSRLLAVRGIDPRSAVFSALQAEAGGPGGPTGVGTRLAKAGAFGTVLSLAVCCGLPIGAATLLGATAAAPFASLDDPWIIAGAALLSGGAAFAWHGRRRASAPCEEGC